MTEAQNEKLANVVRDIWALLRETNTSVQLTFSSSTKFAFDTKSETISVALEDAAMFKVVAKHAAPAEGTGGK